MKNNWFHETFYFGLNFDATLYNNYQGSYKVIVENNTDGSRKVKQFKDKNARKLAIEFAQSESKKEQISL